MAATSVAPLTGVAVKLKVSLLSEVASSVVGIRSCIELAPAGIVTLPATGAHTAPLKNSNAAGELVSVPIVAVPDARLGVNTTGLVLVLESETVKTAFPPSIRGAEATIERLGVSLSEPPAPVPSSLIVPMPKPSAILAFVAPDKLTLKVSMPSNTASLLIFSVIVCVVTPGAKVSVPAKGLVPAA